MATGLASILSAGDKAKVPAGYTNVDYGSVLEYFKQKGNAENGGLGAGGFDASSIAAANNAALAAAQAATQNFQETVLGEIAIAGDDKAVNGFYEKSKHIVCKPFPFISVPLEKDGKIINGHSRSALSGIGTEQTASGNNSVPDLITKESLSGVIAAGASEFLLGVGMNLSGSLGMNYCNSLWNGEITPEDLGKLISAKELYAEVILPYTDTQGKTFVCKVISDISSDGGSSQQGDLTVWNIFVPIPLLCLSNYASHFQFMVGDGSGKNIGDGITFPWAGEHYNHLTGTITNFGPQQVLDKLGGETIATAYDIHIAKWPAIKDGKNVDFCRVRLCVENAENAKGILNKDLPEGFVGFTTGAVNILTGIVQGADSANIAPVDIGTSGQIYIPTDKLPPSISAGGYEKALLIMCCYENGKNRWVPEGVTVDNGGPSWGSWQTTQGAGGLQKCLDILFASNPQDAANIAILKKYRSGLNQGKFGSKGEGSGHSKGDEFCTALKNIALGVDRNLCIYVQSKQWATEYYLNAALNMWKACGFQSAMGLLFCMYAVNSGFASGDAAKAKSGCKAIADEAGKLRKFREVRREYLQRVGSRPGVNMAWGGGKGNYAQWCNAAERAVATGDFNLAQQHPWKDGLMV